MSVSGTQAWIEAHKKKDDAVQRWNAALATTRDCANTANSTPGDGFARATAYYNCRKNKKVSMSRPS